MTDQIDVIDLNPQNATLFLDHSPMPFAGVMEQDQQAGTEQVSFRIPLRWKTLVQRVVNDARFGYVMQPGRLYQHALGEMLGYYAQVLKDDTFYTSIIQEMRDLQEFAYVNDTQQRFTEVLERVAKQGEQVLQAGNESRAYIYSRRVMKFVQTVSARDDVLGEILSGMARSDTTLQRMVRLAARSEVYGGTTKTDALQTFYAGH